MNQSTAAQRAAQRIESNRQERGLTRVSVAGMVAIIEAEFAAERAQWEAEALATPDTTSEEVVKL